MAKKQLAKDQDKFIVRLPDGMRERIKAKADRAGISMNEAVVWVLEREFPAEVTFAHRIKELADLVAMLKDTEKPDEAIENLIATLDLTLDQISGDQIPVDRDFKKLVSERLFWWKNVELSKHRDKSENPFEGIDWDLNGLQSLNTELDGKAAKEDKN